MKNFGDGFFSVFNPQGETNKLKITTSNNENNITNTIAIKANIGQFQCLQVEQILNPETGKLDHKIKFNGNPVFSKSYHQDEVFTGQLKVYVSDEWNERAGKSAVRKFVYEKLD